MSRSCLPHRLEKEALVRLLVLPAGAVEEAVAEGAVVDAAVPPAEVGRRAREPLHPVVRPGTLCKKEGATRDLTSAVKIRVAGNTKQCKNMPSRQVKGMAGCNIAP